MIKHFLTATLILAGTSNHLSASPTLPIEKLLTLETSQVPEKVRVTNLLDYYGRIVLDAEVRILEKLPTDWKHTGKISMSGDYSRAGIKSVKWDWSGGDYLSIKNLGVLSTIKYIPQRKYTERFAPIEISLFTKDDLPNNTEFIHLYLKRTNRAGEMKLVRFKYYLTHGGTWIALGGGQFDSGLATVIPAMPDGLPTPEENEVILHVPPSLKSGTYYLDRIITVAELPSETMVSNGKYLPHVYIKDLNLIDATAVPTKLQTHSISQSDFIPAKPIDPTSFNIHSPGHLGYFAQKPPIPEKLTKEQQAYVDSLRASYFKIPPPLEVGSRQYQSVVQHAEQALETHCTKLANGSYKVKESINFSGPRIWFRGDKFHHRKHHLHIPQAQRVRSSQATSMLNDATTWFIRCPDSPPVQAYLKATVNWFQYQVTNPPAYIQFKGKYGADFLRDFDKLIPLLRAKGAEFDKQYRYLSKLMMFAGNAYSAAWHKKEDSSNSLELGHALNIYHSMFYEPDDRVFFAMLRNFRDNWNMYYGISGKGKNGMIKPDYTFFHHGEVSYWGNITGYTRIGEQYAHTPLDFSPEIHTTLANHTARYIFGVRSLIEMKGGQTHNWAKVLKEKKPSATSEQNPQRSVRKIIAAPKDYLFKYFYGLDWNRVPAAKKFCAGVLGNAQFYPTHKQQKAQQEVQQALLDAFPKLKSVKPQTNLHFSSNWSGFGIYTHGMTSAHAFGNADVAGFRAGDPIRQYGMLCLAERFHPVPLGAAHDGYRWLTIPGITTPALEEKDYTGRDTVGIKLTPGSGSLTFNETDHQFGKAGNYSLLIDEGADSSWEKFQVSNFKGKKSYHFYQDKVVCLGSNYQATTSRPMQTVLIQDMIDPIPWSHRNTQRWNPEKPTLVVDGKTYRQAGEFDLPMQQDHYFISPYGHAWIIPGKQNGRLKFSWKKRESLLKFRFNLDTGHIQPGEKMTQGTGVIATLEQDPNKPSSHHYCVVMNSDGKTPQQLEQYVQQTIKHPGYTVLRHDRSAHAVRFTSPDTTSVDSLIVFEPEVPLNHHLITSTDRRLNLMMQKNRDGNLVLSICDPHVNQIKENEFQSQPRTISIKFTHPIKLLSSHSGLPQANPKLQAQIKNNTLTYTTANGVTDTFVLKEEL